jgi:mRNA-degrading endonuclease YafQ of YafQ-DinJ toxin-antitoxin module
MLAVAYSPTFARMFKKLEPELQQEAVKKIELFRDAKNHRALKVHKLHGQFSDKYSFSVNYYIRIVFSHLSAGEVILVAIGDHDIYK